MLPPCSTSGIISTENQLWSPSGQGTQLQHGHKILMVHQFGVPSTGIPSVTTVTTHRWPRSKPCCGLSPSIRPPHHHHHHRCRQPGRNRLSPPTPPPPSGCMINYQPSRVLVKLHSNEAEPRNLIVFRAKTSNCEPGRLVGKSAAGKGQSGGSWSGSLKFNDQPGPGVGSRVNCLRNSRKRKFGWYIERGSLKLVESFKWTHVES